MLIKKQKWLFLSGIAAAELMVLLLAFFAVRRFMPQPVALQFESWESPVASYDNGFYADADSLSGKSQTFLTSPAIRLDHGAYRIHVEYLAEDRQKVNLTGSVKSGRYLEGSGFRLHPLAYAADYCFEVTEADEITFTIEYNGNGALGIFDASLVTDNAPLKRAFACLMGLFLLLDLGFLFRKQLADHRAMVVSVLGIAVFASLPNAMRGIGLGHDLIFHLTRIDALSQELRMGVFPVRMADEWVYGYSYPASVMYGDFLLYFPAALRIFGFRLMDSYKCYVFLINLLTACSSTWCFHEIFGKKREALLLSLVYVTSTARLVAVFVRNAVGEYSAMMFIPIIGLGVWQIYMRNKEDKRLLVPQEIFCLGLGMAGVVCTHVLSTEMILVVLILLAFMLIRRTVTPRVILNLLAAAAVCILTSLFFTVPFLDYYLHMDMRVQGPEARELLIGIQQSGIWIGELFSFFHSPFGFSDRTHIDDRFLLTPGPILMITLAFALWQLLARGVRKTDRRVTFLTVYAALVLLLSTDVLPWNSLIARTSFGILFSQVQFLYRYVDIAVFPLVLLLGVLMETLPEKPLRIGMDKNALTAVLIGVSVLMTGSFISGYYKGMEWKTYYDSAELNTVSAVDSGEYLPQGVDEDSLSPLYRTEGTEGFAQVSRDGYRQTVFVKAVDDQAWVDFPVFCYPGFYVKDQNGNRLPVTRGDENAMLRVLLPAGFEGELTVGFAAPLSWHLAEMISMLSLAGIAGYGIMRNRQKRRTDQS
ncbi:MAG: hypothetical protein K5696_00325 [Lachnospiraceae bacterium]|nr:hypothetical protein [Lachnospiraceae bacterium]